MRPLTNRFKIWSKNALKCFPFFLTSSFFVQDKMNRQVCCTSIVVQKSDNTAQVYVEKTNATAGERNVFSCCRLQFGPRCRVPWNLSKGKIPPAAVYWTSPWPKCWLFTRIWCPCQCRRWSHEVCLQVLRRRSARRGRRCVMLNTSTAWEYGINVDVTAGVSRWQQAPYKWAARTYPQGVLK